MLGTEYKYPEWSLYVGYALTASSILCIPIYIVYKFAVTPGSVVQVSAVCRRKGDSPARQQRPQETVTAVYFSAVEDDLEAGAFVGEQRVDLLRGGGSVTPVSRQYLFYWMVGVKFSNSLSDKSVLSEGRDKTAIYRAPNVKCRHLYLQ